MVIKLHINTNAWFLFSLPKTQLHNFTDGQLHHSNHEQDDPTKLLASKDTISKEALEKVKESNEISESEGSLLARLNNMNDGLTYSLDTIRTLKSQQKTEFKRSIGIDENMSSAEELLIHVQSR